MSHEQVRICMIGAGRHSSTQLYPAFHQIRGMEVVANCDLDLKRAEMIGHRFGIRSQYKDYDKMIEDVKPDGVMVCISDVMHAKLACEIMAMGCHVLVEKPHAPNLAETQRMLKMSEETGKICMGAYKKRYAPIYVKAKELMRAPGFGEPCHLSLYRAMGGNDQTSPDYLWQWGCHGIDQCHDLMGPVESLQAFKSEGDWRAVTVNMKYTSGAVGNLTLASPGGNWEEMTLLGSGMNALRTRDGLTLTSYFGNDPSGGLTPTFVCSNNSSRISGFIGEMQDYVDAIRNNRKPQADIAQLLHSTAIYEAMMRSLESGVVEQVEDGRQALGVQ